MAIIGGGPAGVCAIKCCVEEGLAPTCYEQHDDIGEASHSKQFSFIRATHVAVR